MKPGPVVPIPEGVSNGAPAVGGKGAHTPPPTGMVPAYFGCRQGLCDRAELCVVAHRCLKTDADLGVLNWSPIRPLPDESAHEHLGNALQAMAELESLLLQTGDFTQDRRALVALVKRRIGWARELVR